MGARPPAAPPGKAAILAVALTLLVTGCAPLLHSFGGGSVPHLPFDSPAWTQGIDPADAWLRHHLMRAEPARAATLLRDRSPLRPRDDLLRDLQLGTVLHHAGRWLESDEALARAEVEVDRRLARSVLRETGALTLSEGVLDFVPSPAERMMIPYYRMWNRLHQADVDGAVVEARRATSLLQDVDPHTDDACDFLFLEWLSAFVYERAGEWNDALVALRRIDRVHERCGGPSPGVDLMRMAHASGFPDIAEEVADRYGLGDGEAAADGEAVVFVERGFAPHRTPGELHVPIFSDELDDLEAAGSGKIPALAALVGARAVANLAERQRWGAAFDDLPEVWLGNALGGAHILRVAWPSLAHAASSSPSLHLVADGRSTEGMSVGNLSRALTRDFHRDGTARMLRAASRSLTRYVVSREVEKRTERRGGEEAGAIAGFLSNMALNVLDQPDLRAWSTLPAEITLVRMPLAAGEHRMVLEADGAREIPLGTVATTAGQRLLLSHHAWADAPATIPRTAVVPR